jgi:hypothetical protein
MNIAAMPAVPDKINFLVIFLGLLKLLNQFHAAQRRKIDSKTGSGQA